MKFGKWFFDNGDIIVGCIWVIMATAVCLIVCVK